MKYLVCICIVTGNFLLVSCNNQGRGNIAEKTDDSSSVKKGSLHLFDSSEKTYHLKTNAFEIYDSINKNRILFDSAYKSDEKLTDSTYTESIVVVYKGYKIKVKSIYLKDSVSTDESNLFNPICLGQTIYFYEKNSLIKTNDYPVKIITQKVSKGNSIKMLEDVITTIGLIKGKKGILLAVEGYGGCNSCSELYALYNLSGQILWYIYRTKSQVIKELGDSNQAMIQFGVDKDEFFKGKYSKVNVY